MPALAILLSVFWLGLLGVTWWAWTAAGSPLPAVLGGSPAPRVGTSTSTPSSASEAPRVALVYTQEGLTRLLTDVGKAALVVGAVLVLAVGAGLLVHGKSRDSDK